MFDFFEEYLDENMTPDMVYLEACDIAAERAGLAYDTYCEMENLERRSQALRMASNSMSFDDMVNYYAEEGEGATSEKKKNLFIRAWEAVKRLFQSIYDKLFGQKTATFEGTAEVPKWYERFLNAFKNFLAQVKAFVSSHKLEVALGAIGTFLVMAGAFIFTKNHRLDKNAEKSVWVKAPAAKSWYDQTGKMTKEARDLANKVIGEANFYEKQGIDADKIEVEVKPDVRKALLAYGYSISAKGTLNHEAVYKIIRDLMTKGGSLLSKIGGHIKAVFEKLPVKPKAKAATA